MVLEYTIMHGISSYAFSAFRESRRFSIGVVSTIIVPLFLHPYFLNKNSSSHRPTMMSIYVILMLSLPTINLELEMNVVLGLLEATNRPRISHSAVKMV